MTFRMTARRALLVSASFPLSALIGAGVAAAEQVVTVAAPTTTATVNAQIATAEATPDPDIKITVTSAGTVTGGGAVTLAPLAAGQGDGAITFSNAGLIGAVDKSGAVTDAVGVRLSGVGGFDATAVPANTLSASNTNLITDGFQGTDFGGTVDFTNSGTIFGGVTLSGNGDTSFTQGASGAIRSGDVLVRSQPALTTTTVGTTTTTTRGSGNTKVDLQGDVVSADGKTFGTVSADSYANTAVTIGGTTGAVNATAGSGYKQVATIDTAAAGKTVVTSETVVTAPTNTDIVKIGANGNVNGDVFAKDYATAGSLNRTTETQDAAGTTTALLFESTTTATGGTTAVTIDAGGKVSGDVTVDQSGTAVDSSIANAGAVGGALSATSTGTSTAGTTLYTYDDKGNFLGYNASNATKAAGGKTSVSVDATGTVGDAITAVGDGGATASVAGAVTNGVTVTSSGTDSTTTSVFTQTDKGVTTSAGSGTVTKNIGGVAALTIAPGGSVGGAATVTGGGGVTAAIGGTLKGTLTGNSTANDFTTATTTNYDPTSGAFLNTSTSTSRAASGKTLTVDVANGGTIGGNLVGKADGGATVTNAGTIAGSVTLTSARTLTTSALSTTAGPTTVTDKTGSTTSSASSNTNVTETVGGAITITNAGTGLIGSPGGGVTATALGDVAFTNSGIVRGQTALASQGSSNASSNSASTVAATVTGVLPALDVTTTTATTASSNTINRSGGSVSGTYAGANGTLNFVPAADGSIFQTADKNSTVLVSGAVFGDVNSTAGAINQASTGGTTTVSVLDTDTTGTVKSSSTNSTKITPYAGGGTSAVTITGTVAQSNVPSGGSVNASGTAASAVTLTSAKVSGAVTSTGTGLLNRAIDSASSYDQTVTKGVYATNAISETSTDKISYSGGTASADLLGTTTVGNSVTVSGVGGASSKVDSGAKIAGSLNVSTDSVDSTSATTSTYARDATAGTIVATQLVTNTSAPAAASGTASVTLAGAVAGSTSVSATRGDATATITGVSTGGVSANANGAASSGSTLTTYGGKAAATNATSVSGAIAGLPGTSKTSVVTNTSNTVVGGKATIVIDTAQALKDAGTLATNGAVSANGIGGASVAIKAGSILGGSVSSGSVAVNAAFTQTETFGATHDLTSLATNTLAGGTAAIDNAGTINGGANSFGVASTVNNSGKIGGSVAAQAIFSFTGTTAITDSNIDTPALRTRTTTTTATAVGGDAKVTNAAGALIAGAVSVAGKTGSLTNSGIIAGTSTLGLSVGDYTVTDVRTGSSTTTTLAQPATLATQTYTLDQNGLSRGITVTGATVASPIDGKAIKTANITATINLNSGSATLGNITAQTNAAGARLTNTTVNLNGAGFLGADVVILPTKSPVPTNIDTPYLTLTKAAVDAGFGATSAIRVSGVAALNKTGAGTFVINGANYVAPAAAGALPTYTLDVGAFNITGGEVQLATPGGTGDEFGIKGDINNSAALVIGRRLPSALQLVGNSLIGTGAETIQGITVRQVGNYTQTATGTTVIGVTPSLVRFYNGSISTGSTGLEPLAPVTGGVNVAYFTVPGNSFATASTPSRVNITGNLNLAGTVAVDVTRDGLFLTGDGYTVFTYTGTGTVTANVTSNVTSPFVKFSLVNDTTAKTVRVSATRSSYATAATDRNAAAAAVALDSALPAVAAKIQSDANGGAVFTTVSDIGYAQDIANIASALDFSLTGPQAAEVFRELSSGEFYGSLSALDQNLVFGDTVNQLTNRRAYGQALGTQLWINPVAGFARYGGGNDGASPVKVTSYGGAFGLDLAYSPTGVFGFGGAYGEHDVNARGTPETGRVRTWTIGAYVSHGFGPLYVNALLDYGFSRFSTKRTLTLLARTMNANFRGRQFDGSLEAGYDFKLESFTLTPFAKVRFRDISFNGFTETGGGGVGLIVDQRSHTEVSPVAGLKLGGSLGDPAHASFRPYVKAFYTFRGDVANDRTVRYLGGGDSFVLRGVRPQDYGTVEAGIESTVADRFSLYLAGSYSFGGQTSAGSVRGGLSVHF